MPTVNEVIKRALRSIGVLHHNEDATDDEAADALTTLNDMLNAWRLQGIDLEHLDVALTDEMPYAGEDIAAIRYNLAMELAGEFGVPPPAVTAVRADSSFRALQAKYAAPDELKADEFFRYKPNRDYGYYSDIS